MFELACLMYELRQRFFTLDTEAYCDAMQELTAMAFAAGGNINKAACLLMANSPMD